MGSPLPLGEDTGEGKKLANGKLCLGRVSDREVVLTRYLLEKLRELNPGLPEDAYAEAIRQIVEFSSTQTLLATNRDKYSLFKDGVQVAFRKALATFAGTADGGHGGEDGDGERDPAKPEDELLSGLQEAIAFVRSFLEEGNASLDDIIEKTGFERNAAIVAAKEAANENDETRKRFEVMSREVFRKFKACINIKAVNAHRKEYDAISTPNVFGA